MKPTYDPGLQLTPFGRRLIDWLAVGCFLAGIIALTIEAIPAGILGATLWLIAIGLHKWAEGGRS